MNKARFRRITFPSPERKLFASTTDQRDELNEVPLDPDMDEVDVSLSFEVEKGAVVQIGDGFWERVNNYYEQLQEDAKKNTVDNLATMKTWCAPFIGVTAILAIVFLLRGVKYWNRTYTVGYLLVLFGFSTEIVYFLGVIDTFQVVGDWEIVNKLVTHKYNRLDSRS